MPRRLAVILVGMVLVAGALPATAQTDPPTPTRLAAEAGMAGFVDGQRPIDLAVTIATDVLFAGTLEAKLGQVTQALAVEIPAGGSKVYNLRLGTPVGNPNVRLRLFSVDSDSDPVATLSLSLKVATDHLIAAVVGPDELIKTIDDSVSAVTERDVVGVGIPEDRLAETLDPARYLVLAQPVELPEASIRWVAGGGRLVVDNSDLDSLGIDLPVGAGSFPFGSGWVIGVDKVVDMDAEGWDSIFAPVTYRFAAREIWQSPDNQLMQSAVSGGDQRVPTLPWLLAALVGYAVLLGPVNFALLRKLGRRELAWATVPVLALAGVLGFWIAGRQRLAEHVVSHASVVVADESGVEARTASVLVVGNEGARTLRTTEGWETVPAEAAIDFNFPAGAVYARLDPTGGYDFELSDLGAAGLASRWHASPASIPELDVTADGEQLEVGVQNDTDLNFWTWGIVARGRVVVSKDPLAPGDSGTRSIRPGRNGFNEFGTVGDAVINELQMWEDPFIWQRLGPLSQVAATMIAEQDAYFFGFTDQLDVPLVIDGSAITATGTSLVVVPIDLAEALPVEGQSIPSTLLDAQDASFIDFGPGYVYVQGPGAVVGWNLFAEESNPKFVVNNNFGPIPTVLDMYDWPRAEFVAVANGDVVDLSRFRNERGEVILRASNDPENNFIESGFSPYSFTLEW